LNSKERVICSLSHQEPDRVPIDFDEDPCGITYPAHLRLKEYLNLEWKDEEIDDFFMMRKLDERILVKFGSDFRRVTIKSKKVGSNLSKGSEGEFIDSWGIPRKVIGYYSETTSSPLSDLKDIKELDEHPWPNADDYEDKGLKEKAIKLDEEGWAVIGDQPIGGSIFDVAWMLRGFENFMTDLYVNPGIAEAIMDRVLESQMSLYDKLLRSV